MSPFAENVSREHRPLAMNLSPQIRMFVSLTDYVRELLRLTYPKETTRSSAETETHAATIPAHQPTTLYEALEALPEGGSR